MFTQRKIEELQKKRGERDREAVARHHEQNRKRANAVKNAVKEWESEIVHKVG